MRTPLRLLMTIAFSAMLLGCEVIGDIFKTGFYSGIFFVVLIVGAIIFMIAWFSRKKR